MPSDEEFYTWSLDPARTNDELFTLEILLETALSFWNHLHKAYTTPDWDAQKAHKYERMHNPAYRSKITKEEIGRACVVLDKIEAMHGQYSEDRPIRDLQALQFFPALKTISLNNAEVEDLSPLRDVPLLASLTLTESWQSFSPGFGDLGVLHDLPELTVVSLNIHRGWPDLSWLGTLPKLTQVTCSANLLCLLAVKALPKVEVGIFTAAIRCNTPLRSVRELPEMPLLKRLTLEGTHSLAGIERYPNVLNVKLKGTFKDLGPLAGLQKMTFLSLEAEFFQDLTPLASAPRLRELLMVREETVMLDPLTDSVSLREVRMERCGIMATELAALNAALSPTQDDFEVPPPVPAKPLRFINYHPQHEEIMAYYLRHPHQHHLPQELQDDTALAEAFARWCESETKRRLDALLGPGWGVGGHFALPQFRRARDVSRMREIIETMNDLMMTSRYPWSLMMRFSPHADMEEDMDDIAERQTDDPNPDRHYLDYDSLYKRDEDADNFRKQRRADYERRSKAYRMKLRQEQGLPIDPAEFTTQPPKPPTTRQPEGDGEEDHAGDWKEDEDGGGLEEAEPGDDAPDLSEDLEFICTLKPGMLWVTEHMRENAEYHWGESAEDWHSLGSLEDRPKPG